jgi:hypothetical protein
LYLGFCFLAGIFLVNLMEDFKMRRFLIVMLVLIFSGLFIAGCGDDVKSGKDGKTPLTVMTEEEAGENCENGGIRIDVGFDLNDDGELDEDETQDTKFICNGEKGDKGDVGEDGEKGADGADGRPGEEGKAPLVKVEEIGGQDEDHGCENGGFWVITCEDDGEGECVEGSENKTPVCHGAPGEQGSSTFVSIEPLTSDQEGHTCGVDGGYWLIACVNDGNGGCEEDTETRVPVCHGDRIYGGDLYVDSKCKLKDLDGYDVIAGVLEIRNISDVEEINMPNLKSVGMGFKIQQNSNLKQIHAEKLAHTGRCMYVDNNNELISMSFPNLISVGRSLWIYSNPKLTEISMPKLEITKRGLWLYNNHSLEEISMPSFISTGRGSWIYQNNALKTISFPEFTHTATGFWIYSNTLLETISFPKFSATGSSFWVYDNPVLTEISFPALETVGSERERDCDDEPKNSGGLSIYNNASLELVSLPLLKYTFGRFDIRNNPELTQFVAGNLYEVGVRTDSDSCRFFRVSQNTSLETFELPALIETGGYFEVNNNDALISLGFEKLETVGGYFSINGNLVLPGFDFSALTEVVGNFTIRDNPELLMSIAEDLAADITIGGDTTIENNKPDDEDTP